MSSNEIQVRGNGAAHALATQLPNIAPRSLVDRIFGNARQRQLDNILADGEAAVAALRVNGVVDSVEIVENAKLEQLQCDASLRVQTKKHETLVAEQRVALKAAWECGRIHDSFKTSLATSGMTPETLMQLNAGNDADFKKRLSAVLPYKDDENLFGKASI